jgi:hypothetical protein
MQVTMRATFSVKQVEIARSSLDEEQIPWGASRLITKLGDLGASDHAPQVYLERCAPSRKENDGDLASGVPEGAIGWYSRIELAFGATKPLLHHPLS